jgi:uncharacterized protein YjbI with pentapeptide repeats
MMDNRLRKRWETPEGRERAEEAIACLVAGRPLAGLGAGEVNGRVDLRGLPAPIPRRLRRFETAGWFAEELGELVAFRGARLEGLDFSGAQLQSLRFFGSQIADCRLDGARCQDWRMWDTEVADCSFARASLRDAAVGTWHEGRRNAWRRVDFRGADFRVVSPLAAVYEDCDFSGARLAKVRFEQCSLTRCRFAGALREVVFDGRRLEDRPAPAPMGQVDFTGAVFDQVEFMGTDLARVTLPQDPDVRLIRRYRCVLEGALVALNGDGSLPARMLRGEFSNRLRMMRGTGEESNVFNRRDYIFSGGEELVGLADRVFAAAEADCLAAD